MTETTQTILDRYQIRKTKKQKNEFIKWATQIAENAGNKTTIEKGLLGSRNIIIGNPEKAKVIYTAHYDTCAVLPFPNFITPKNFSIYLLYQIALAFVLSFIAFGVTLLFLLFKIPFATHITELMVWILIAFMLLGPANKHTANDNTSGVTVILDIINKMPAEAHDKAAFILFDMEEAGLIGSFSYRLKHNKMMKEKLLINFDCVSDGNNILMKVKKKAKQYVPLLKEVFTKKENMHVEILTQSIYYPSDQEVFPCAVGVAALKKTRIFNILYLNRIHTKRDTVYQEMNIDFLVAGAIELAKKLQ